MFYNYSQIKLGNKLSIGVKLGCKLVTLLKKRKLTPSIKDFTYIIATLMSVLLLGGPAIFQNLTDFSDNQHIVLLVLQNLKSKISEKMDQN